MFTLSNPNPFVYEIRILGEIEDVYQEEFYDKTYKIIEDICEIPENSIVIVYINSFGGSVDTVSDLIFNLKRFKNLITVCSSVAESGGAFVFLQGKYRLITPNAYLMIHQIQT